MQKLVLLCVFITASATSQIKVMSYNLRVDFGGDGENNWEFRRDFLVGQIAFHHPDFVGTQEGKLHQLKYIDSALTHYSRIGISRDNSATEGEFSAILFDSKRFELLKEGTFWLSETPLTKSKGWDAALERICTYGLFEEKLTKKKLYVFNTHLDHVGKLARTNSAKLILQKIAEINKENLPVIVTGDFNSEPTSDAYQSIVTKMNDSRTVSVSKPFGPSGTFNGFKFHQPVTTLIDYIFTSRNNIRIMKYAVLSDSKDCRYPSDHLPVLVEIELEE